MEPIGFKENLSMLREFYPNRIALSLTETALILGCDYRTVKEMTKRARNPLPMIKLTEGEKSRCGIPVVAFARWLCRKE